MKKEENKTKTPSGKKSWEKTRRVLIFALLLGANILSASVSAMAAGTGGAAITASFGKLTDLVEAFVSSIGTIIVLWGIFEMGNATQSNDGMMQSSAFKRIGGGLVMALGPQLLPTLLP